MNKLNARTQNVALDVQELQVMRTVLLISSLAVLLDAQTPRRNFDRQQLVTRLIKEGDVLAAELAHWNFRQRVYLEQSNADGRLIGHYEKVWRYHPSTGPHVVWERTQTMALQATKDDEHDMWNVQRFLLTSENAPRYRINYLRTERLFENDAHVFQIEPRTLQGGRYFSGLLWADPATMQVLKLQGKGVGVQAQSNQDFPRFETFFETFTVERNKTRAEGEQAQIDVYWFPTHCVAEDQLWGNDEGRKTRIQMTIDWTDYRREQADSSISFGDVKER